MHDKILTFVPDILTHTLQIATGTILKNCTLNTGSKPENVRAQVLSVQSTEPYAMEILVEN
jgi:hypothetical protein